MSEAGAAPGTPLPRAGAVENDSRSNHNVQGLRGFAALAELGFHTNVVFQDHAGIPLPGAALLAQGYGGVDIFFVISGYVIALSTAGRPAGFLSALRFFEQRALRIYSGYWPILALIFLHSLFAPGVHPAAPNVFHSIFLTSTRIDQHLMGQAWSLAFEMGFYAIFAVLIAVAPGRWRSWSLRLAYAGCAAYSAYLMTLPPVWATFAAGFVFEFLSGAMLFLLSERLRGRAVILASAIAAPVLLVWGGVEQTMWGLPRALCFGGGGTALVALCIALKNQGIEHRGWFSSLGGASYALYLSHYAFLLGFAHAAHGGASGHASPGFMGLVLLAAVISAIAFSLAYYRLVERPLYQTLARVSWWRPSAGIENLAPRASVKE